MAFTEPIANANSFLAMFMLGLMMSFSVSRERMAKVARLVGLRAAFSVVLTCIVWLALPVDDVMRALLTLLVWSPASALAPMYTQMSGGDGGLAGFANAPHHYPWRDRRHPHRADAGVAGCVAGRHRSARRRLADRRRFPACLPSAKNVLRRFPKHVDCGLLMLTMLATDYMNGKEPL